MLKERRGIYHGNNKNANGKTNYNATRKKTQGGKG